MYSHLRLEEIPLLPTLYIHTPLLPTPKPLLSVPSHKVHYVERVNAELHELLERYEAEFFQHQLQLEGDKQAEATHARMLQVRVCLVTWKGA